MGRDYRDRKANLGQERHEFKGHYPDLILASHGMTVALMEVETEESLGPERAQRWKDLSSLGPKLILMVPAHLKAKTAELLWKEGLAGKVSIATYDVVIRM